jgi:drug/metabolite transporter (DMT)-like permease
MKNIKYVFMVLLGGTLYGMMSSFVKLSYRRGFHAAEISFWQAFLAALILGVCAFASRKRKSGKLMRKDVLPLLLAGCAIGLTNFLYYESVSFIPASLAIILLMQFTWFSLLLEWLVFQRRPSRVEWLTVFFILIGTLLAGRMFDVERWNFSTTGVILALCSSLTYAVYIIANGRMGKGVRWQSKSAMIMVGSSLCIFLVNGSGVVQSCMNGEFMLWAIFLAVVGTTVPTALFAAGISKVGAGLSSILMTIELPVAVLCAGIVLKEPVSPLQISGVIMMLAAISAMNIYKLHKPCRH